MTRFKITNIAVDMIIKANKYRDKKKLDEALKKIKPAKSFKASSHLGKVKWNEDALEYQKRIRGEWNYHDRVSNKQILMNDSL